MFNSCEREQRSQVLSPIDAFKANWRQKLQSFAMEMELGWQFFVKTALLLLLREIGQWLLSDKRKGGSHGTSSTLGGTLQTHYYLLLQWNCQSKSSTNTVIIVRVQ